MVEDDTNLFEDYDIKLDRAELLSPSIYKHGKIEVRSTSVIYSPSAVEISNQQHKWYIFDKNVNNWAASRQNQQNDCAPNNDSDQPGQRLWCALNG